MLKLSYETRGSGRILVMALGGRCLALMAGFDESLFMETVASRVGRCCGRESSIVRSMSGESCSQLHPFRRSFPLLMAIIGLHKRKIT